MDKVSPVLELYIEDQDSENSLVDLLKDDWGLFSGVSNQIASSILDAVLGVSISRNGYSPIRKGSSEVQQWELFKEELKHKNRFFPSSFPDEDKLKELLAALSHTTGEEISSLYRARINEDESRARPTNELSSPPPQRASGGRANPVGISYLYLGSTKKTAISEIRPHKNEVFTIGIYSPNRELNLIDLRSPKEKISPFVTYDESQLEAIYTGLPLLEKLGSELTKPIAKSKAEFEYLSSQYLCEFIKFCGYDGVIYKSSLGDGDNYAIFFASLLTCNSTELHNVNEVNIEFAPLPSP